MNQTLNERAKTMRLHVRLPKMFWEDSVTTAAYLINRGPSVPLGFRIPEEEWQGKEVSLTHLRVFGCDSYIKVKDIARDKLDAKFMKCTFISYGSNEMGYRFWDLKSHKDQVVLVDSPENLANKSIVSEHELSSEITQSLGGSLDTSEGSENSGSFKDSGRSDEEDSKDRSSSKEEGFENPQLRRSTRQSRAPVRLPAGKKALQSKWVFKVKEEQDGKKKLVLSIVAAKNLHLEQLDVKTAFLHGDLDEDIYVTQPEGFQSAGKKENLVGQGSDMAEIKKLKRQLSQEFEIKDLGKVLEKFNIKDAEARCQPLGDHFKFSKKQAPKTEASRRRMAKVPYASAIGNMMYTMVFTRPDIAHAVGVVSRFMSNPGREHWEAVKWLLRYLKVGGTAVSWMSRIQKCVAMSTTEAEYMAIAEAGKEFVWLKNFLEELDRAQTERVLFCDNQSDIHLAKNLVFHD
ncbi:retrovirus-related pol polyprotein from transposon TNT 1-94 [Tanacetum coccineum]